MKINWTITAAVTATLIGVVTIGSYLVPAMPFETKAEAADTVKKINGVNKKVEYFGSVQGSLIQSSRSDHITSLITQRTLLGMMLSNARHAHDDAGIASAEAQIQWIDSQIAHPDAPAPPAPP